MIVGKDTGKKLLERIESAFETIDKSTFGIPRILRLSIDRFSKMRGVEGAASISFFMIFSLPPLLILIVSIASFFLEVGKIQYLFRQFIEENIPVTTLSLIVLLNQIIAQRQTLGIIGLVSLAWSGSRFLMALTANINRAYPTARLRSSIENQLIAFVMIALLILLLVISSVFSSIYSVITTIEIPLLPFEPPWSAISHIILIFLRLILFLALFSWVPNTTVKKKAVVWAALFATFAWELTAWGFGVFLNTGLNYYNVLYGSLGTLVALMFWIYLDLLIIIYAAYLGAEIDKYHRPDKMGSIQSSPGG